MTNRIAQETSPCLQQHADNPVDWYAWNEDTLRIAREQRIRPRRDEIILGAWNGLMIAGMACAARVFNRPEWLQSAQQAMNFVQGTLWNNSKLLATYKDGKAHLNVCLDDHAFLLNESLEQAGSCHSSLCIALDEYLQPASLLVLCGPQHEISSWQESLRTHYWPDTMQFALAENLADPPDALNKPLSEHTSAWLCQGTHCFPPITKHEQLLTQIQRLDI